MTTTTTAKITAADVPLEVGIYDTRYFRCTTCRYTTNLDYADGAPKAREAGRKHLVSRKHREAVEALDPAPAPVDPFIPVTQCGHEDVEWCGEQLSCVECGASGDELEDPAPIAPGQLVFGPAALIAADRENTEHNERHELTRFAAWVVTQVGFPGLIPSQVVAARAGWMDRHAGIDDVAQQATQHMIGDGSQYAYLLGYRSFGGDAQCALRDGTDRLACLLPVFHSARCYASGWSFVGR